MATTTFNRRILPILTTKANAERSSLLRLCLGRGILALAWAAAWARAHATLDDLAIALLVAYPLIDAASSLIDYCLHLGGDERRVTAFNGCLSVLAAGAIGAAGTRGVAATIVAFGTWAVFSGAAQLFVGLRRGGQILGKQWPMLIAGGLSALVGVSYVRQAVGGHPSLDVLSVYAAGGGFFFIFQAGLLAWRTRPQLTNYI